MTAIIAIIFIVGYLAIAFEHPLKINKAASALLTGVICWSVYALWGGDKELVSENLGHIIFQTLPAYFLFARCHGNC